MHFFPAGWPLTALAGPGEQPAQGTVRKEYGCGNSACIKVLDPAGDLVGLTVQASEALWFGVGVAAFFGLFLLCALKQDGWSLRSFFCCGESDDSSDSDSADDSNPKVAPAQA